MTYKASEAEVDRYLDWYDTQRSNYSTARGMMLSLINFIGEEKNKEIETLRTQLKEAQDVLDAAHAHIKRVEADFIVVHKNCIEARDKSDKYEQAFSNVNAALKWGRN